MENTKITFYKNIFIFGCILIFLVTGSSIDAASSQDPKVEVGNITRIKGIRDNQLMGYGIITGLAGSGDSNRSQATVQSVANMLENYGLNISTDQVSSRNLAAVMVTATLPPFVSNGDKIDVQVNSMGDADSLQGGTLLMTPLKAPNGEVFAVAQGAVTIGGYNESSGGSQNKKNHPTVGRVPEGAIVEQEINFDLDRDQLTYLIKQPNFETASLIAKAVNNNFEFADSDLAQAVNAGEVQIQVPTRFQNNIVEFISQINNLEVRASIPARVVINERTGTIVMGHNVRISTVSVAHSNVYVKISSQEEVSQPPSFSEGETETTKETEIQVEEEGGAMQVIPDKSNIQDLVKALNTIGASPRDIIAILQAIKREGALHAELVIM